MQVVTQQLIYGKTVLLRLDIDVPLKNSPTGMIIEDDFRLLAGLPTLELCLHYAKQVVLMGHIGRPTMINGKPDEKSMHELSIAPIIDWLEQHIDCRWDDDKLKILENLRFEEAESLDTASDQEEVFEYAKQLASLGDFFVNESFAAYHPSASTTILPTLLPHAAGLNFFDEVTELTKVIDSTSKPLVVIMGGAKVEDKLPVIEKISKVADAVLVGGRLPIEIKQQNITVASNVMVGKLNETEDDIAFETVQSWENMIKNAKMVVWNGPLGKLENQVGGTESGKGTYQIAQMIINSGAESIVGGGDTTGFLNKVGLLKKFHFASTGGGAMLKFLIDRTLPTIEALNS